MFLVVIILQLCGLVVAISMKTCCYRDASDYEDFEKQQEEAAQARAQAASTKAQVRRARGRAGGRACRAGAVGGSRCASVPCRPGRAWNGGQRGQRRAAKADACVLLMFGGGVWG